ncbi:probable protein S-acyltransferase 5 [Gastrolobium bilobum]|uniref:probable protein S-acyltransferase 5 n=1 Tax=Gastrolobium bilobum TaxID=150636 RepID=UPI002AB041B2|nr:probable protein S-acyltransferase 5 [Gastrolobium bilobum]
MYAMQPPPPPPENPDSEATGAPSLVRTYHAWKGNNVFFLQGRLIFGPDVKSIFISIFLIITPIAVFCAFVARKLLDDFPHHSGLSILIIVIVHTLFVLITLVLTSGRDPGIVPRNAYPPEPDDHPAIANMNNGQSPRPRLPRTKDVIVNGIPVKIKYCDTCMLYRPLRCSHCSVCDNCVERFDHHCPWVGQCIGLRNYRFYYIFVFSATLLCLYVHGFSWVYIKRIMDSEEISIWKAMTKTPASVALIIYTFVCVWFVGGLTVFHTYLISTNQSTYENFRYRYDRQINPYNRGIAANFKEVFCTSIPPSKNNFRSKVPKEPSDSSQRVGVQSLSPMMRKTTGNVELVGRPVYNESDEEESDYRDRLTNEELSKDSGLTDMSTDLSRTIRTEGGEGQDILFLHSLGERTSRKWDITPEVLDRVPEVGESNCAASDCSSGPSGNSTKAAALHSA